MSRIPQIEPEAATGAAAELLNQVRKALGVVPNMTKVMATSPALLEGYLALVGALANGVLSAGVRERLAVTTAEANGCGYCLSAHTYIGTHVAKVDPEEMELARSAHSLDPHTDALLALSRNILEHAGDVDDATLGQARAAGVTDPEIGEVVGHIALNVLTNYFNVLSRVDNDWPVVTPRAHAA